MFENRESHPSYGTLRFSRAQSGSAIPLFGSSIKHRDTILLRISEAELVREFHRDEVFPSGKTIIEVEMSQSQFAEAITSLNFGSGVPVTIRSRIDMPGIIERCPYTSKKQEFEREFASCQEEGKKNFKEFQKRMKQIFDDKKTIGKTDREELIKDLEVLYGRIFSNQEFVYKQFNEQMDKTITEAKCEIEAFVQKELNTIALEAIENKRTERINNPVDFD